MVWWYYSLIGFCVGVFVGAIIGVAAAIKLSDIEKKANRK